MVSSCRLARHSMIGVPVSMFRCIGIGPKAMKYFAPTPPLDLRVSSFSGTEGSQASCKKYGHTNHLLAKITYKSACKKDGYKSASCKGMEHTSTDLLLA